MEKRHARDLRLDLFKGLALLVIFINHVGGNPLAKVTPSRFGPSDAAEVFVFISGYAVALAYGAIQAERGFLACQRKALSRCRQLWVANIATMLACGGIVAAATLGGGLSMAESNRLASFGPFLDAPLTALAWHGALLYLPYAFDILALYIVLIALVPAYLWLHGRFGAAAFLLPVLLYAIAQVGPDLSPPNLWEERWNFSPLAWQIVFFLGMSMALLARSGAWRLPRSPWLLGAALAVLAGMTLWKAAGSDSLSALLPDALRAILPQDGIPFAEKDTLGPMRLLHFLALACAAALLVPQGARWLRAAPARLLTDCGRHSLPVFCVGIVLSFCGTVVLLTVQGAAAVLAVNAGGVAILLVLAAVIERQRTLRPRPVPLAGARLSETP